MKLHITKEEESMLKQYASVYRKERDEDLTANPIVIVEDSTSIRVNQKDDYDQKKYCLYIDEELYTDEDLNKTEILSVLKHVMDELNVDPGVIDSTLEEMGTIINNELLEEKCDITLEDTEISIEAHYYKEEWQPKAYFFTKKEARNYMKYQAHNLRNSRIFTANAGYDNRGDYPILQRLLLRIGEELLQDERKEK
ncbi:hypothetical protein [Filifactor alocis]|uniref:hypothetical protein n=1 Tax=Filifactor alocis TaxID=143361 RepID=UPI003FA099F6